MALTQRDTDDSMGLLLRNQLTAFFISAASKHPVNQDINAPSVLPRMSPLLCGRSCMQRPPTVHLSLAMTNAIGRHCVVSAILAPSTNVMTYFFSNILQLQALTVNSSHGELVSRHIWHVTSSLFHFYVHVRMSHVTSSGMPDFDQSVCNEIIVWRVYRQPLITYTKKELTNVDAGCKCNLSKFQWCLCIHFSLFSFMKFEP